MGRTIQGFLFLASAKICTTSSALGLNESTLFGLDYVAVRSVGVASSLGGLGEKQVHDVNMRSMWTGAALCHHCIYDRKSTKTR